MQVEIRRLGPADAEPYRELRLEALRLNPEAFGSALEDEAPRPLERWQSSLADPDYLTYGAFADGALAATATLAPAAPRKSLHKAFVYAVYTRPAMRGRGLATLVMQRLLTEGRALGRSAFRLSVSEPNREARRLYERLGFVVYGREPDALRVDGRPVALTLMALDVEPRSESGSG